MATSIISEDYRIKDDKNTPVFYYLKLFLLYILSKQRQIN